MTENGTSFDEIALPMVLAGVRLETPPRQRNASFHAVLLGEETDVLELLCNGTPSSMFAARPARPAVPSALATGTETLPE